jgi:hypothetical protein
MGIDITRSFFYLRDDLRSIKIRLERAQGSGKKRMVPPGSLMTDNDQRFERF